MALQIINEWKLSENLPHIRHWFNKKRNVESIVALERSDANTNQFGIEANQKMMLAKEKRDLADKKRQEAIQLATEYDNLVHIETQRKLDAEAQRQAQDKAKRIEAERREKQRRHRR